MKKQEKRKANKRGVKYVYSVQRITMDADLPRERCVRAPSQVSMFNDFIYHSLNEIAASVFVDHRSLDQ